ncbi:MAG: right-handed parallel beta-helix repeat-containing protein [Bacteroidales bacterium]|nr:right-handed parallel beta-helix repeat-containing protein [Bacteroidales bacterium]
MRTTLIFISFLFTAVLHSFAATLRVPSDHETIQEAIDASQNGDTILVADGVYKGDIHFWGLDSIIVKSESGAEYCVIDCHNESFPIAFALSGIDQKSIIEGFTIKNASMGIWAYGNSAPTIKNNIIDSCEVGINCGSMAIPAIISNKITNCRGGIYLSYSDAVVANNIINNNIADKGSGIYCENSSPLIINNTLVENYRTDDEKPGGGIYIKNSSPGIINNIIAFSNGMGIVSVGEGSAPDILYNDIYGNEAGNVFAGDTEESLDEIDLNGTDGNISEDPAFYGDEYALTIGSPCIDAGSPDTEAIYVLETDFYGNPRVISIIDIGAAELNIGPDDNIEYISICEGEEYEGHTETGMFVRTLTSSTGEDSIVVTFLTVNPSYYFEEDVTICEGEDYFGFTTQGEHRRDLQTTDGCDSVYVITLTVRPADQCHMTFKVPSPEYATIQSAMDIAVSGDTVLVADGIYSGEGNVILNFRTKSIVVKSENGPDNCIIDCEEETESQAFLVNNGETDGSCIKGFTVRNAPVGIAIYNSSPTVKNNIIEDCRKGIHCDAGSNPVINSNMIRNCVGEGNGGGISLISSSAVVSNNLLLGNSSSKGGGIYCLDGAPSIINNTIIGSSGIKDSSESNIILVCEYDNYQRIYECFVPVEEKTISGGGIFMENASPDVINNIIAFSKDLPPSEEASKLTRWFYDDLMMRYNYEGVTLKSVSYYVGFKNVGETGDIRVYSNEIGGSEIDTTFTAEKGECFWIETESWVSSTKDYGGLDLYIESGNSSIHFKVNIDAVLFTGCYNLYDTHIQSHGIEQGTGGGIGIIEIGTDPSANILYNDLYGNIGGNYVVGETVEIAGIVALDNIDGNISDDPLLDEETYELLEGSPCIDAGNPDFDEQDAGPEDFFGNYRVLDGDENGDAVIDIGAVEMQKGFVETSENVAICQGESYEGWTETGEYQRRLIATDGKDSIVTTRLTVNPVFDLSETISICEGDSYNGWDKEGTYPVTYTSIFGCDSIVTTILSLYPAFKPTFTVNGNILVADEIYEAYQWYEAGGPIEGATGRELEISRAGEYHMEATGEHGCTYASDTVFVMPVHSDAGKMEQFSFSILPNPNKGLFDFRIDSHPSEKITIKLVNSLGQVVESRIIRYPSTNQTGQFDVTHLGSGIYNLVIISDTFRNNYKIVVQ